MVKKDSFIEMKLRKTEWNRIQGSLNHSNYLLIKNMNGKPVVTYSKFSKDKEGFNQNRRLYNKITKNLLNADSKNNKKSWRRK